MDLNELSDQEKSVLLDICSIPLTQGLIALVDAEDFKRVSAYKWRASKDRNTHYAMRSLPRGSETRKAIMLHRFIMDAPVGLQVDHINGNGLDCRKHNMRICTNTQNAHNQGIGKLNTSGYKGVDWHKNDEKWRARIRVSGKRVFLGYFDTPEDAASAYDKAAKQHFGEFARTNFGE